MRTKPLLSDSGSSDDEGTFVYGKTPFDSPPKTMQEVGGSSLLSTSTLLSSDSIDIPPKSSDLAKHHHSHHAKRHHGGQKHKKKREGSETVAVNDITKSGISSPKASTGFVFEELYLWHNAGCISQTMGDLVEPLESWENADTKRRFVNLMHRSGLIDRVTRVKARMASEGEIIRFHSREYVSKVKQLSRETVGGEAGEETYFGKGGFDIAKLAAGGVLSAIEEICDPTNDVVNAYCLTRPPGHHAVRDSGMGFCIFNNIVLAALHARTLIDGMGHKLQRIAIVDFDVHHGNGTQQAFYDDENTLFISIHEDNNYPINSGRIKEVGKGKGKGTTINIPLLAGSGSGAYQYCFEQCVMPALKRFDPELILVSSGFDASFVDPLSSIILSSEDYYNMSKQILDFANASHKCRGKVVFVHEGGYSKDYVPFCGVAVIEALLAASGNSSEQRIQDPYLEEVQNRGYQAVQPNQAFIINLVAYIHGLSGMTFQQVLDRKAKDDKDWETKVLSELV